MTVDWLVVTEILEVLAWPTVVLVLLLAFKRPITKFIDELETASVGRKKIELKRLFSVVNPDDQISDDEVVSPTDSNALTVSRAWRDVMYTARSLLLAKGVTLEKGSDLEVIKKLLQNNYINGEDAGVLRGLRELSRLVVKGGDRVIETNEATIFVLLADRQKVKLEDPE